MKRAMNIALRTAHLGAMGVLLGGSAFDIAAGRLTLSLWLAIGTGLALAAAEAGPRLLWFHQGRGVMTMAKLGLLCALPLAGGFRVPILLAVVAIGSVGSHMPGRFRHYSVWYRRVVHDVPGPEGERGPRRGA